MLSEWQSDDLAVFVSNLDAVDMESEETLEKDQKLLWVAYVMVLVYCHIALFKNSCAQCKSHLAVISCLSGKIFFPAFDITQALSRDGNLFSLWSLSAPRRQGLQNRICNLSRACCVP